MKQSTSNLLAHRAKLRADRDAAAAREQHALTLVPHAAELALSHRVYALPAGPELEENTTTCAKCHSVVVMVTVRMNSARGMTDRIRYLDLVGPHGLTIAGRDSNGTHRSWVRRHWCRNQGT